jgi:hypothetical protein
LFWDEIRGGDRPSYSSPTNNRDRVLLKEGIPTVRFTAKEYQERTTDVVTELISLILK